MIAAGYTMDIYCDAKENCKVPEYSRRNEESIYGQSASECRKIARKMGWKFRWDTGEAKCPYCTGKKEQK